MAKSARARNKARSKKLSCKRSHANAIAKAEEERAIALAKVKEERTGAAANELFGTVELFEEITSYLDVPTVLKLKRVSKSFSNIINNSTQLQRQLFLLPIEHYEYAFDTEINEIRKATAFDTKSELCHPMTMHPFYEALQFRGATRVYATKDCPHWITKFTKEHVCKKMFLSQPPTEYIDLCIWHDGTFRDHYTRRIVCETGITLGMYLDAMEEEKAKGVFSGPIVTFLDGPDVRCSDDYESISNIHRLEFFAPADQALWEEVGGGYFNLLRVIPC